MTIKGLAISHSLETFLYFAKTISCSECRNTFVFSEAEQEFFHSRGLSHEPKRCPHCRVLMRMRREGRSIDSVTQINCMECGEKTTVPFLPREERKIYCIPCRKAKGFRSGFQSFAKHDSFQKDIPI